MNRSRSIIFQIPDLSSLLTAKVTAEEKKEWRKAFEVMARGSSTLSKDDVSDFMARMGLKPDDAAEFQATFAEVDTNGDSKIDWAEVEAIMTKKMSDKEPEEELRELFALCDSDSDGYLNTEDLKKCIALFGDKVTDEEVAELIHDADLDQDKKISFDEFLKMIV